MRGKIGLKVVLAGCLALLLMAPIGAFTGSWENTRQNEVNYVDISVHNDTGMVADDAYRCGGEPLPETIPSDEINLTGSYPPTWDWRNAHYAGVQGDWTSSIKDQGSCGSCWDFAAMGALEATINIREGYPELDVDLSEQYLLSCPSDSGGCSGWNAYYAYRYCRNNGGALPEDCFPYQADDTVPCSSKCSNWQQRLIPITDYGVYRSPSRDDIKSKVYNHGPVVASMAVYDDFGGYTGGVYEHPGSEPPSDINHQVVIVGYNDDQQCWICKNSWGTEWGENGWFRIAYGDCQIEHEIIYVEYDEQARDWPPVADAGGMYEGEVEERIQFDGSNSVADNEIVAHEWDFGDGATGTGATPSHAYSESGIYTVELTVTDSQGKQDTDTGVVYVDIWQQDDCWVYNVEMNASLEEVFPLSLEGSVNDLVFQVKNVGADAYHLDFEGRINGQVYLPLDIDALPFPLNITGWLRLTTIQGDISFTKSGFGLKETTLHLHGKARILAWPIPFILPVPFDIQATVSMEDPIELFGFQSFEPGSNWIIPQSTLSLTVSISPYFGVIISKSYEFTDLGLPSWLTIYTEILGKETVTVPAGTYEAYKIGILPGSAAAYYYAPAVNNIVKIQTHKDFPYGQIAGELISTESTATSMKSS